MTGLLFAVLAVAATLIAVGAVRDRRGRCVLCLTEPVDDPRAICTKCFEARR